MTTVHDAFIRDLPFTYWRGIRMQKNPCDLQLFHEAIFETKPELVIETGSGLGGSALFFADTMELAGMAANVVSIDTNPPAVENLPTDMGIEFFRDDSAKVRFDWRAWSGGVMVVLDSDHSTEHVHAELQNLAHLVTPGCFLVVEDTSHTGAGEAVEHWLEVVGSRTFEPVDQSRYLCTYNTWLKRR